MEYSILIILLLSIVFLVFVFAFAKKPPAIVVFEELRNPLIMQILVPRENDKTPLASEQMFSSLHGIMRDAKKSLDTVSFEIVSVGGEGIKFIVVAPQHLAQFVEGQIYAQYPNAEIRYVKDYTGEKRGNVYISTGIIELEKDYIFPIKTFRNFEVDPLAAITSSISDLKGNEEAWIQMVVRPIANYWQDRSKKYINAIKEGKSLNGESVIDVLMKLVSGVGKALQTDATKSSSKEVVRLQPGQQEELTQIETKMLKLGFEVVFRVITKSPDQIRSEQILRDIVASFKQFTTAHLNSLIHSQPDITAQTIYQNYLERKLSSDPHDTFNIEELASVYHLPNISVETPNIVWSRARKSEPPMDLPIDKNDKDITIFGQADYRGIKTEFGLRKDDRRRHFYLLGKTGVGKSTLFKNMFISDILAGNGACFIDPHGDTVEELLDFIPEDRMKDVIYFDPGDTKNPIGFNLLELEDPEQRDLVADGIVEVFKKQFGTSWGPRLQYLLTNAVATALEAQGTTLLAVMRILMDKNYRKFILKQVKDPILIKFWEEEYTQMSQNAKLVSEAIAPIQNKVGRFISSSVIRNIIGQVKSSFNLRDVMDNKKILLVNLAQGKLGEESSALLGGMLITRLQATAMGRVDIPIEQRNDFYLYVDEFQNFATDSFAKILSEARKFRLCLTMTNQYIDQIPLTVRQAIFGNVGSIASFVVSQADAGILANEFSPVFSQDDLVSLEAHSMYVKLCISGMTSKPFSAKSLNLRYSQLGYKEKILEYSRATYSAPKDEIEDKIKRWSEQSYSENGNRSLVVERGEGQDITPRPPRNDRPPYNPQANPNNRPYRDNNYNNRDPRPRPLNNNRDNRPRRDIVPVKDASLMPVIQESKTVVVQDEESD